MFRVSEIEESKMFLDSWNNWLNWKVKVKVAQSCPTLCDPMDSIVHGILQARILEWVAFPFSRGIFPTQGSNPGLPHCNRILYQLSHKGNTTILEWIAYPFSSGSSQPRNRTRVSWIAGRFFTTWATQKPLFLTGQKKQASKISVRTLCSRDFLAFPAEEVESKQAFLWELATEKSDFSHWKQVK